MKIRNLMAGLTLFLAMAVPALAELTPLPVDDSAGLVADKANYTADGMGYEDESLSVQIEKTRAYDTDVWLCKVKVSDASQIRTAMAGKYGSTKTAGAAVMAKRMNAVFAVNGDYFSYRAEGYLVRQGKLYRNHIDARYDMLIIDDKGDFYVIQDPTEDKVAAFEGTMVNTFNFGPILYMNGEKVLPVKYMDSGSTERAQRLVACQTGPLSYLFVATAANGKGNNGLTMEELVDYVATLDVQVAYNLDGGGSSSIILGGKKINSNSSRPLCDILYFSTLIPAE